MRVSRQGMGSLSPIHMAGLAHATCRHPWDAATVFGEGCVWGGIWSRKGLTRKAAPAGQGEALLHQLRKHHPGQLFVYMAFYVGNRKKGGRGKGRGVGGRNQVHFCLHIFTKYIYLFTHKKAIFLCKRIVLFCLFFFPENSWVYGLKGFFLALNEMDTAY